MGDAEKCDDILKGRQNSKNGQHRVHKLVLTGGPCGGKTTAQYHLHKFFTERGWKVFVVPETPTIFINGGVVFGELNPEQNFVFQTNLLRAQMNVEAVFFRLAETLDQNAIVICDRGTNDIRAYIDADSWNRLRSSYGLSDVEVRDQRYDQVIHLTTAADGTDAYTLANNTARSESKQLAIELDMKTRNAWVGHPYLDIVDNSNTKSFDDKMNKVLRVVVDRMGLPVEESLCLPPPYTRRNWACRRIDIAKLPEPKETFDIQSDFLKPDADGKERVLISRSQPNGGQTLKLDIVDKKRGALQRVLLSKDEYLDLLKQKDMSRPPVVLQRTAFFDGGTYFTADVPSEAGGQHLLRTYTNKPIEQIELPAAINVEKLIE